MNKNINQIIKKGKAAASTPEDRQEMLALFHRPGYEYDLKDHLLNELETAEAGEELTPRLKKLFYRIWIRIENEEKNRFKNRYLKAGMKIAAALIIGLITGIIATTQLKKEETVYYTAHSPRGSVSEWVLPDSTVIFLNADSRIKYSAYGKKGIREVFLEGEAWFDVTKNKKNPFVVQTAYYNVHVTGTRFNVKAYESDMEIITTLEEGSVLVRSSENFTLAEDIALKPGEQLILNKETKEASLKTVKPVYYTSWKDNKLIFINMKLRKLIVLLERKYGVDIEVKNREILDLHFDGTIKNESIIEFLDVVQKTLPIHYEIAGQKIVITNSKN